jgi:hypothetical protein
MQNRRAKFKDEMLGYYRYLSNTVTIQGSKQRELFSIDGHEKGEVHVTVNELDHSGRTAAKIYERIFDPADTRELRIYGMEGNDSFLVTETKTPITVKIIGGPGADHYVSIGDNNDIEVYDVIFEKNEITGEGGITSRFSANPLTNVYNRQQFKHDYVLPGLSLAYNIDDGVIVGGELEFFNHKFRKEPYSSRHAIGLKFATNTESYQFYYEGDFLNVRHDWDLILRANMRAPRNVTNYFGIGNNTVFDRSKPGGIEYYRTQYDFGNFSVALRKNLQSWMNADIGPVLQYYQIKTHQNAGKYVTDTVTKPSTPELFDTKYFAGAEARVLINSKNNQVLPTRGAELQMYLRQLVGLNADHNMPTQMGLDLAFFMSISSVSWAVLATRFGVGHNIGDFDFPHAQYLSGTTNLRGYRKDRFAGRSMVYNNTELRIRLHQFKTYLFPGSWGILLFNDIGRVWASGEVSKHWHDGYGGGFWVSPVHRFVLTAAVARSEEQRIMPIIGFGFQF